MTLQYKIYAVIAVSLILLAGGWFGRGYWDMAHTTVTTNLIHGHADTTAQVIPILPTAITHAIQSPVVYHKPISPSTHRVSTPIHSLALTDTSTGLTTNCVSDSITTKHGTFIKVGLCSPDFPVLIPHGMTVDWQIKEPPDTNKVIKETDTLKTTVTKTKVNWTLEIVGVFVGAAGGVYLWKKYGK